MSISISFLLLYLHLCLYLFPTVCISTAIFTSMSIASTSARRLKEKEQKLSCSNGVSWELHLFTALLLCPSFKDFCQGSVRVFIRSWRFKRVLKQGSVRIFHKDLEVLEKVLKRLCFSAVVQ